MRQAPFLPRVNWEGGGRCTTACSLLLPRRCAQRQHACILACARRGRRPRARVWGWSSGTPAYVASVGRLTPPTRSRLRPSLAVRAHPPRYPPPSLARGLCFPAPPPPPSRANWTRLVHRSRTNWTRLPVFPTARPLARHAVQGDGNAFARYGVRDAACPISTG